MSESAYNTFNQQAREMFRPYVGREIVVRSAIPFVRDRSGQLLRVTDIGIVLAGHGHLPYDQILLTPTTFGCVEEA
jgi:hypothetical protein